MEVKIACQEKLCLRPVSCREQTLDRTLDISVGEPHPVPKRILGCWGQTILRGKQWHGANMSVSGGVKVWVLYESESKEICSLTDWVPFEGKWTLPDRESEGTLHCEIYLCALDARCITARKIQVRLTVCIVPRVLCEEKIQLCTPEELPEGVMVKSQSYPIKMPVESGERIFDMEEILEMPSAFPACEEIIYGCVSPCLKEFKVMGDKVVFRGCCRVHVLYRSRERGTLCQDFEIPFSQYQQLGQAYTDDASAAISLCVTNLELSCGEQGEIQAQIGLVAQYIIYRMEKISCVEDEYSICNEIETKMEKNEIPILLDHHMDHREALSRPQIEGSRIVDTIFCPEPIDIQSRDTEAEVLLRGSFRVLYYDLNGELMGEVVPWEETASLPAEMSCSLQGRLTCLGNSSGTFSNGGSELSENILMEIQAECNQEFSFLGALEVGEKLKKNPNRPSVVICKKGNGDLWSIAKQWGTTVESICKANALEGEPEPETVLLIPIP